METGMKNGFVDWRMIDIYKYIYVCKYMYYFEYLVPEVYK